MSSVGTGWQAVGLVLLVVGPIFMLGCCYVYIRKHLLKDSLTYTRFRSYSVIYTKSHTRLPSAALVPNSKNTHLCQTISRIADTRFVVVDSMGLLVCLRS